MIYMGVWDGNKETAQEDLKLGSIGPRGIQGIPGLRGPAGKEAVLPKNLVKTTGFTMAGPIDMALNSIKGVKYPSELNDCCPKSYIDNGRTNIPADNITGSNANFTSDINMNNQRITNLKLPVDQNEPATKKYTDDGLNDKISKMGDYMHGDLSMSGGSTYHSIIGLKDSDYDHSVVTKKYVDEKVTQFDKNLYVKKSGSKLTGDLDMNSNRITNLITVNNDDAVSKAYVDSKTISTVDKIQNLHYNGNDFILIRQPIKQTSYFILQQNKSLIQTNTHGTDVFDNFTPAQLVLRKTYLWDMLI